MNFAVHAERCAKELAKTIEAPNAPARRRHHARALRHATMAKQLARSPAARRIADDMIAVVIRLDPAAEEERRSAARADRREE